MKKVRFINLKNTQTKRSFAIKVTNNIVQILIFDESDKHIIRSIFTTRNYLIRAISR